MSKVVNKREVEELLGCVITDEQFNEALEYARRKHLKLCTYYGILNIRKAPTPRVDASQSGKMLY